jgi:ATP-dependent DNA ligase
MEGILGFGDPHSIFTETIFTRRSFVASSPFIKAMHPKTEILPDSSAIGRILENGWVGQVKIHGHRAQIHIPSDPKESLTAYTRQGKKHAQALSPMMSRELFRLFRPSRGWNVIDAEWLKPEEKLFVFDFLKLDGEVLRNRTFPERWGLLPRAFISPHISVLPLLRDLPACTKILSSTEPHVEGLVFKSTKSTGFSDSSIVRCRKRK